MKVWRTWGCGPLAVRCALVATSAAPVAQATVAVYGSVNIHTAYLGDTTNTTYAFAVTNNSSASESIGSVQITSPSAAWSVQGCGPAPAGWVSSGVAGTCTFNSQ